MEFSLQLQWQQVTPPEDIKTFDRTYTIQFGSGSEISGTAAPEFSGDPTLPNPEELFTASVASCLMLTFLVLAANKGYAVKNYQDKPAGKLNKNSEGKMAMTEILLTPEVSFHGESVPDDAALKQLFDKAHHYCFISNSIKTHITVEPKRS